MTIAVERPPRVIGATPALTLLPPMTWPAPGQLWLVDPARMLIEVYSLENGACRALGAWGQGEIAASAVLPGWRVVVDEVCASPA